MGALFYFGDELMGKRRPANSSADLTTLRCEITDLVARNAMEMVQRAIDAVHEEGQYQAMKYLFEMIGIYPAGTQQESPAQDSLARLLLEKLGLPSSATDESKPEKSQPSIP